MDTVSTRRSIWRWPTRILVRRPLFWLAITGVALGLAAGTAHYLRSEQNAYDLQTVAVIGLLLDGGEYIFPIHMVQGVELMALYPQKILEQFILKPEAACRFTNCNEVFGVEMAPQALQAIAKSVRDEKIRQADADATFWTGAISWISIVLATFAFAHNVLRPAALAAPEIAPSAAARFPSPPSRRKSRPS